VVSERAVACAYNEQSPWLGQNHSVRHRAPPGKDASARLIPLILARLQASIAIESRRFSLPDLGGDVKVQT
jgi:hypothetical protein